MDKSHVLMDSNMNRAVSYTEWPFFEKDMTNSCNFLYGQGRIQTSINDMERWVMGFLSDQGKDLFGQQMPIFESGTLNNKEKTDYGYGWSLTGYSTEETVYSHGGSWLSYRSLIIYNKSQDLWMVILSNYGGLYVYDLAAKILSDT